MFKKKLKTTISQHLSPCIMCQNQDLEVHTLIDQGEFCLWIQCSCGSTSYSFQTYVEAANGWNQQNKISDS